MDKTSYGLNWGGGPRQVNWRMGERIKKKK